MRNVPFAGLLIALATGGFLLAGSDSEAALFKPAPAPGASDDLTPSVGETRASTDFAKAPAAQFNQLGTSSQGFVLQGRDGNLIQLAHDSVAANDPKDRFWAERPHASETTLPLNPILSGLDAPLTVRARALHATTGAAATHQAGGLKILPILPIAALCLWFAACSVRGFNRLQGQSTRTPRGFFKGH